MPFLHDLVVLFGVALVVTAFSHRLRLPPLVGFLITGMVVGPSGLALVEDSERVEVFAELGVVFLLFSIGLEFSVERLRRLGRYILLGGSVQVGTTLAVAAAAGWALGLPLPLAIFAGCVVALSSTAIVLKLYQDRRELDAPHGKAALGILLFQDFLIVPLLLVVPILAGREQASGTTILLRLGGGVLLAAAVLLLGRYLLPPVLRLIVRTRIRELFVLGSLFACLSAALAMELLGFSLALGAFLAGILIAETDYHHQVLAETAPFRDVFNSIFFISVGMLLQLDFVASELPRILALGSGVLLLKAVLAAGAVAALGLPMRIRLLAGLGLAQIGEFSLVLLKSGNRHGLLTPEGYQLAVATAVLTMLLAPLLIALAPRLAARWPATDREPADTTAEPLAGHVVIAGFGLNGRHLAQVLKTARQRYLVVDLNAHRVQMAAEQGEPILYGDVSRRDIQLSCGIPHASIAVFAISDPPLLDRCVRLARQLNPRLYIIARTRLLEEIEDLQRGGADEVIAEEFETSIEISTRVLRRLHLPGNVIRTQARLLRQDGYQMLRSPSAQEGLSDSMLQALAAGTTDSFRLDAHQGVAGRSIRDLDLRRLTGTTILAVVRGDQPLANPSPDLVLAAGDTLVLTGSHAEIDAAFRFLEDPATFGRAPAGDPSLPDL